MGGSNWGPPMRGGGVRACPPERGDRGPLRPHWSAGCILRTRNCRWSTADWGDQRREAPELHRDWAVIDLPVNRSRHVFERRRIDAGNVTLSTHRRRERHVALDR